MDWAHRDTFQGTTFLNELLPVKEKRKGNNKSGFVLYWIPRLGWSKVRCPISEIATHVQHIATLLQPRCCAVVRFSNVRSTCAALLGVSELKPRTSVRRTCDVRQSW